jgi:DNA-binding NtrC family response regulator
LQVRALPGALALPRSPAVPCPVERCGDALALNPCDLVISNTKVEGADGVELIQYLRKRLPDLPIIYLANVGRSTPEIEAHLPPDVPILREPFQDEELLAAVGKLLDGKGTPRP